jgi:Ca2+-binding RTX toxin-like protein
LTGGAGTDTLTLSTAATATMTALVTGFEKINFAADIAATITTVDANVASGVTFTVDGAALITANALTFNGAAELDGKFSITGGAAADVLTGGALADTISGGLGADTITGSGGADSLTGGVGADVFVYTSASVAHSTGSAADTITDFATTSDKISVTLNYSAVSAAVDVNTALVASVGDLSAKRGEFVYDSTASTLSINVNNDNLVTTQDIKINVGTVASGDLIFNITGSAFGDVIVGGVGADTISGGGGADNITGGAGGDAITLGAANDSVRQTVIFTTTSDGAAAGAVTGNDTVIQFDANANDATDDLIQIGTGALKTAVDDDADGALDYSAAPDGADAGNEALVGGANQEATVLVDAEVEIAVGDLTTAGLANLLAELGEEIDFTGIATGQEHVFIVNVSATQAGIILYTAGTGGDDVIAAADIQLLGIITHNDTANMVAGNLTF